VFNKLLLVFLTISLHPQSESSTLRRNIIKFLPEFSISAVKWANN